MSESNVPPPDNTDLPGWADQSLAKAEVKGWPDEDALRGLRHKNEMLWLSCYGWIVVGLTVIFTLLFVSSLLAWTWHYVAPPNWTWLTPDQLSKIQSIIFSGSLGAIVTSVIKKQIDRH
jgi:hypothetical protein